MTKNMGTADRTIRTVLALTIGVLFLTGTIRGTLAIILGIVALLFLTTSLLGWCPAYVPFGLSTRNASGTPASRGAELGTR